MLPAFALLGCEGVLGRQALPKDPLFLSQRPVEGKAITAAPPALAMIEPPSLPAELRDRPMYARQKATTEPDYVTFTIPRREQTDSLSAPPRQVPGVLTNRPLHRDGEAPAPRQP